jgi:hypothetical protein
MNQKTDKLRIRTQFHVAFAPNFDLKALLQALREECGCQFPVHYQGIIVPGHFFLAGIRDAE